VRVRVGDDLTEIGPRKIRRERARRIILKAAVDGVGSRRERGKRRLEIACRRKKFNVVHVPDNRFGADQSA
jgi:hypothetical protein